MMILFTSIFSKFGTLRIKAYVYTVDRQGHRREGVAGEGGDSGCTN